MVRYEPKWILADFLRARITDPRTRLASTSDTFTATNDQTSYTLTPTTGKRVHSITAVTVAGVTQSKWGEYYIDTQNQKMILVTGATTGQTVIVTYLEGTTDWIYPDKPKESLAATSYPRISIMIITSPGNRQGKYDADVEYNIHFQVDVWAAEGQTFTISGKVYEGDELTHLLGMLVCEVLRRYEDDMYPKMYDYQPITGPRDLPFDKDHGVFRSTVEFKLKTLNLGVNL